MYNVQLIVKIGDVIGNVKSGSIADQSNEACPVFLFNKHSSPPYVAFVVAAHVLPFWWNFQVVKLCIGITD